MLVREYIDELDRSAVIALWKSVFGYSGSRNDPAFAIDQKLNVEDHLFFVASDAGTVLGTIMAGYDGHRGWIYSLAVRAERRRQGLGHALLQHAESALVLRGCPKINLQILETNAAVVRFYQKHGYIVEPRISMGKVFEDTDRAQTSPGAH